MKVPSLDYDRLVRALQRDGWVVVRQRGSHIRMQRQLGDDVQKLTVPAHKPLKRSTLAAILKAADLGVERLRGLLRIGAFLAHDFFLNRAASSLPFVAFPAL
ncbi:MAG: type II toxin-antitoxin system HicA family toxin [bacterium]